MPRWPRHTIKYDDPEAPRKLTERITELRRQYQRMKAANRLIRKGGPNLEGKLIAQGVPKYGVKTVAREGYDPKKVRSTVTMLRQAEKKLAEIQRARKAEPLRQDFWPGCVYFEDPQAMRLGFEFEEPPSKEVCKHLQKQGFVYAPSRQRWQRFLNSAGRKKGRMARQRLKELM